MSSRWSSSINIHWKTFIEFQTRSLQWIGVLYYIYMVFINLLLLTVIAYMLRYWRDTMIFFDHIIPAYVVDGCLKIFGCESKYYFIHYKVGMKRVLILKTPHIFSILEQFYIIFNASVRISFNEFFNELKGKFLFWKFRRLIIKTYEYDCIYISCVLQTDQDLSKALACRWHFGVFHISPMAFPVKYGR